MGCPNFTAPVFVGGAWGKRPRGNARGTLPATLARLLMQPQGSQQVSPQNAQKAAAVVYLAGVAQSVEHLFCKQVVRGSSPRASSAVGPRMMATGSHARGFRVLASFGLRSDAHALQCVPLRSSSKPRQNAELRARVIEKRPFGAAADLANAKTSESCPSGQREQAVNLPAYAYAGSNPALSTAVPLRGAAVSIICRGSAAPPRRSEFVGAPPQVFGSLPKNSMGGRRVVATNHLVQGTKRRAARSLRRVSHAGVAQLVERQPSKLNVESSSLFSRSCLRAEGAQTSSVSGAQLPPAEVCRSGRSPASWTKSTEAHGPSRRLGSAAGAVNSSGPPLRFLGPCPKTFGFAGGRLGVRHQASVRNRWLRGGSVSQPGSQVWALAQPSRGPERSVLEYVSTGPQARHSQGSKSGPVVTVAKSLQQPHAHLAQLVEHVLGKDEVTSSILVVGSKR